MPILGANECAYWHYVHSPTPARGMSPAGRPGLPLDSLLRTFPGAGAPSQFLHPTVPSGAGPTLACRRWVQRTTATGQERQAGGPGKDQCAGQAQAGRYSAVAPGRTCPVAAARGGHMGHYVHPPAPTRGMSLGVWSAAGAHRPCSRPTPGDKVVDVPHWQDHPPLPATWQRCDAGILPLWWDRLCSQTSQQSAALFAAGLFTEDRRRPIAQWYNPAYDSALLVAPETSPEWPVQRFGIFYAPPGGGFTQIHSAPHEWHPRDHASPPPSSKPSRAPWRRPSGFCRWRCTSSEDELRRRKRAQKRSRSRLFTGCGTCPLLLLDLNQQPFD